MEVPFDEEFLKTFKSHVPSEARTWDPDMKHWIIDEKYAAQAERDCKAHFENIIEC